MHDDAVAFVMRNMKLSTVIDEATGKRKDVPEYPVIAIREIVMNALVHRDYSIYTDNCPITIKMFSDSIEIENPGGLYGRNTIKTLGEYGADTRNPYLANVLEIIGETENRYSGIPTIRNAMAAAHLKKPLFENVHGVFRVTLLNEIVADENFDELAQAYLMAKYVAPMIEKGLLKYTIPEKPKSKNQRFVRK